jgi:hypothetical protein
VTRNKESAIPLILLVDEFLGFAYNSFEKGNAATVLAAFQNKFVKIQEMHKPIERRGIKFKRE